MVLSSGEKKKVPGILGIYTGDGKGKTTAALGCALRSLGWGWNVVIIQFIKGSIKSGEEEALKVYGDRVEYHVTGRGFTWESEDIELDKRSAIKGWTLAKEKIFSGKYHLVILDELTYLIQLQLLTAEEILTALITRPDHVNVIITGRSAHPLLIDWADIVTEVTNIRHPYDSGQKSLFGIDL